MLFWENGECSCRLVTSKYQHFVTANPLSSETKRKKWKIESKTKKKSKFNKNYFATDLHEILLYTRWDLSPFLAKIFFNNGLATRGPIIFKSVIRIPLYIYRVLPILFDQRPRFRVEIHTSFNSWFSFFVSPSRSPNREKFRQFVRRGSSSVIETKHASSCDQHARASLLFTQITSMKRYNLSLRTNHEFVLPQRRDPSNIWSVSDRFIPDDDLFF